MSDDYRAFDDAPAIRRAILANTLTALQSKYPISNERYTLRLADPQYRAPKDFTPAEQKQAILRGRTLGHNIVGTWELVDNATSKVLDRSPRQLIMQVPYMTDRGTVIFNGSEYTIANQMRLQPGIYSRVKENGLLEAHFNVKGGTGPSFRVHMEPDTGVFRMHVGQANLKLYPLMRAMGVQDRDLQQAWGRDLLQANVAATDPRAVQRAYHKLVREPKPEPEQLGEQLDKAALAKEPKFAVNYVMNGALQQCGQCAHFIEPNACTRVQGFVAPTGWCVLWRSFSKWAQDADANRVRTQFVGTIVCEDSTPGKEWIHVKVHPGLAEAAWEALSAEEPEAEKRIDNPHITLVKRDDVLKLIEQYGKKWKTACGNGRQIKFSLQNAMVDLNPEGWDDMDRVWFLEVRSPQLRAYRKSLGLSELPHGDDGEQPFHITIGVHPAKQPRGASKIASVISKQAVQKVIERLVAMVDEAQQPAADASLPFDLGKAPVLAQTTRDKLAAALGEATAVDPDNLADLAAEQAQTDNEVGDTAAIAMTRLQNADTANADRNVDKARRAQKLTLIQDKQEADKTDADAQEVKRAYVAVAGITAGMVKRADDEYGAKLRETIEKMELDEDTTEQTMGKRIRNVSPATIVDATRKLIAINNGEQETDDRDSLAFQRIYGPEDFFPERIARDVGGLGSRILWQSTFRNKLRASPGALSPQMKSVLLKSGLSSALEEVNPLEIHDQLVRITRMGEGGMPGVDSIPDESRDLQSSHLALIDPVKGPESMSIGVDGRATHHTYKGKDGKFYAQLTNAKTGKRMMVSAQDMTKSIVAFPGELARKGNQVRAMIRGRRLGYVARNEVDYEVPHASHMFSAGSNLVPMVSAIKGGRLLMGSKYASQSLPLREAEAPLVQSEYDDGSGRSFEQLYGTRAGAVRAQGRGIVEAVSKDEIRVRYQDGTIVKHPLYNMQPYNRKTVLHNTPVVAVGDKVGPDSLLAKSNFTDNEGTVAIGRNLKVAYLAYRGNNADDAVVISESAAKKLSSEHLYPIKYDQADSHEVGKNAFLSLFPGKFDKRQMGTIGDEGVVKPGTVVNYGDPLVLAVDKRKPRGSGVIRGRKNLYQDVAEVWDHESPGVVTDVSKARGGWRVFVKAYSPMQVGDKLSNRMGGKGVVSKIVPDDQMIHGANGEPYEVCLSPLGVVSRINPGQLIEAALGKVARKTGKKYVTPSFMDESYVDFAKRELQRNGMSDTEDVYDPVTNRKIPKVFTGTSFLMKLHHMAEPKLTGRDVGAYTSEGQPARGPDDGAKRMGNSELNALISHGALSVVRDAKIVRGQRNDDYWRALRMGLPLPSPRVPMVYDKFLASLTGAGINLRKQGDATHLYALTDDDVTDMKAQPLTMAQTVKGDTLEPVEGGLFDVSKTGGHGGTKWSAIKLNTPIPNPVMEEPIRHLLGLTQRQFEETLSGKHKLASGTGAAGMLESLKRLRVTDEIAKAKTEIGELTGNRRDEAVKRLGYLQTLDKAKIRPDQLFVTKVPVLPPVFRPITAFNNKQLVADANKLYLDLMRANDDFNALRGKLGDDNVGDERLQVYSAYKAVTGLGDPVAVKTQQEGAKGLLKQIFGASSPKLGSFQRKLLGAAVDTTGRGVVTPNPSLNMDQVGLPEETAWVSYRPFVMRNLIRRGMGAVAAARAVADQTDVARQALIDEMGKRPVMITRAPVLHKYGVMAAWPVLTKGNTLQVPPIITPGFNMDFDGDTANYHVPVSDDAVQDAINKMLPSKNLKSVAEMDVHYYPRQEFLHGLHLASTAKKKGVKTFRSKADVLAAYNRGELAVGDQIDVKG